MFYDRTALFIDGAYFDKLVEHEFNWVRVDYAIFSELLTKEERLFRTYYYHCPPYLSQPPTEEELRRLDSKDRFFSALRALPRFQLRLGWLQHRGLDVQCKPIFLQKQVDVMLGIDLIRLAATQQISKAILLAGDSDFIPAVDEARHLGVQVSLWHGPLQGAQHGSSVHRDLWLACDERHVLTQSLLDAAQLQYNNANSNNSGAG
jgi:uncharacterized LabA/DUF88 family protein